MTAEVSISNSKSETSLPSASDRFSALSRLTSGLYVSLSDVSLYTLSTRFNCRVSSLLVIENLFLSSETPSTDTVRLFLTSLPRVIASEKMRVILFPSSLIVGLYER